MHIIEEMVVFRDAQPVQHIELDAIRVKYFIDNFKLNKGSFWLNSINDSKQLSHKGKFDFFKHFLTHE